MKRGVREGIRIGVILGAACVLLWLVLALTVSTVFSTRQPGLALRWWPWSSSAAAHDAAQRLQGMTSGERISLPRRLAWKALAGEPANAVAARDLGLTYALQGNAVRAERLFRYAESLSRRDHPTQMWLIETNVQRGNVQGALKHYDRAMRTDVNARSMLIPILVQAAQDPAIAASLAKIIVTQPNWSMDFIAALVSVSPGADALATIVPAARLDPAVPAQQAMLATALRHMVDLGAIIPAYRLYVASRGSATEARSALRDGSFDGPAGLIPFEWQLASGKGNEAVREKVDGANGQALSLYGNTAGEMARELLLLRPGRYQLSGLAGAIPTDEAARPTIAMVCAADKPIVMASFKLPASGSSHPARFVRNFTVMPACAAQWIFVNSGSVVDQQSTVPWLDDLKVVRAQGVSS